MDQLDAQDGTVRWGGQGEWAHTQLPPCRLVLPDSGLVDALAILTAGWEARWRYGLFQNDFVPRQSMTLLNITPATFSGYAGLQPCFSWSVPLVNGPYAISNAHELIWTHDGGPVGNWIYGYYVLNLGGVLMWAERFCPAPATVDKGGLSVRLKPTFWLCNNFPD